MIEDIKENKIAAVQSCGKRWRVKKAAGPDFRPDEVQLNGPCPSLEALESFLAATLHNPRGLKTPDFPTPIHEESHRTLVQAVHRQMRTTNTETVGKKMHVLFATIDGSCELPGICAVRKSGQRRNKH